MMAAMVLQAGWAFGPADPPARSVSPEASVVLVKGRRGDALRQGSGVVVAPGLVVTNAHVVSGTQTVEVHKGSQKWVVRDLCVDQDRDLCLMTLPGCPLAPAPMASPEEARPGRGVLAIGFPEGGLQTRPGRIVANWSFRGSQILQSDAPISPGSSGGGLFTDSGRLLGITTFIYGGNGRINFSIPMEWIGRLQTDGTLKGQLVCPGVSRENITQEFLENLTEDPANWGAWDALTRFWVEDSPRDPSAWFARGLALGLKLRRRVEDTQGEASSLPELEALMEESLRAYRHAVRLGPRLSRAWNNLGVSLDRLGRFGEARVAFIHATDLDPRDPLPWMNLGSTLVGARKYEEAVAPLRQGLALQGDDAAGWARLAYCEGVLGRGRECVEGYRRALRLSPMQTVWWGDLYQALHRLGDEAAAAEALDRVRRADPALALRLQEACAGRAR